MFCHRPDPGAVDHTSKGDVITLGGLAINLGDGTIKSAMGSRRQDYEIPVRGSCSDLEAPGKGENSSLQPESDSPLVIDEEVLESAGDIDVEHMDCGDLGWTEGSITSNPFQFPDSPDRDG